MAGKNYKDMTPEEKIAAFDKLQEKRQSRKGSSTAKRKAVKYITTTYKTEFEAAKKFFTDNPTAETYTPKKAR